MATHRYLAHNLLNGYLKGTPYTLSGTYLALLLTPPAAGEPLDEVPSEGTGYERPQLTFANPAVKRRIYNSQEAVFPNPTDVWATETNPIKAYAIMDAPEGGNALWSFLAPRPRRVLRGDTAPIFPVSSIRVSFDPRGILCSDYIVHATLNGVLGGVNFTPPTEVYQGILTGLPDVSSESLVGAEIVAGGGYGRKQITFADADLGYSLNDDEVVFDTPLLDWATKDQPAIAIAIADASAAGRWLFASEIPTRVILSGFPKQRFKPGEIKIMIDEDTV